MALKRSVSFMGCQPMSPINPPKLVLDAEYAEQLAETEHQHSVIQQNPFSFPIKRPLSRCPSEFIPTRSKPQVKFPEPVAMDLNSVISATPVHESKWANLFVTPDEPATELDSNQGYSSALQNWVPCSWEGILKLPIGTWVQYTSNVYPEYKLRKKIVCIIGVSPELYYDAIHVWTPMSKDQKHYRLTTTDIEAKSCRAGYHLMDVNAPSDSKMTLCMNCLCRGWKLTKGNENVKRIFYVSPWSLKPRTVSSQ